MSDVIKGARVTLKIDGRTLIDLHSEAMRQQSAYQGGGIVSHAFKVTPGGHQVVLEYWPEDHEPQLCDCD